MNLFKQNRSTIITQVQRNSGQWIATLVLNLRNTENKVIKSVTVSRKADNLETAENLALELGEKLLGLSEANGAVGAIGKLDNFNLTTQYTEVVTKEATGNGISGTPAETARMVAVDLRQYEEVDGKEVVKSQIVTQGIANTVEEAESIALEKIVTRLGLGE